MKGQRGARRASILRFDAPAVKCSSPSCPAPPIHATFWVKRWVYLGESAILWVVWRHILGEKMLFPITRYDSFPRILFPRERLGLLFFAYLCCGRGEEPRIVVWTFFSHIMMAFPSACSQSRPQQRTTRVDPPVPVSDFNRK